MFDPEQAITAWRQRMLAAGIKTPVPLEELESHLRDDVEQRMGPGLSTQQAFEAAVQRIGPEIELKNEFQKAKLNQPMKLETHKLLRKILLAIAGLAIGMGLVLPAVAKLKEQGSLAKFDIAMLLIGTTTLTGSAMFGAHGIFDRRKA